MGTRVFASKLGRLLVLIRRSGATNISRELA